MSAGRSIAEIEAGTTLSSPSYTREVFNLDGVKASAVSRTEVALVIGVLAVLILSGYDAVRQIPPLADDLWMTEYRPGQIFFTYVAEHGWAGRVLGQVVIDLVNSVTRAAGWPLLASLLAVRTVSLALVYIIFRRLFALPVSASLAGMALLALTPAGQEGWTMLCVTNLTMTAPAVLASCGLFGRAATVPTGTRCWKLIAWGVVLQTVANALYEQVVFVVPAFVCTLVIFYCAKGFLAWRAAFRIALASVCGAIFWLVCLFASGYVASRAQSEGGLEASDLLGGLNALWLAFGKQNLWRAVELIRTRQFGWWDQTVAGLVSTMATIAVAAGIALVISSRRAIQMPASPSSEATQTPRATVHAPALMTAAIIAAYSAVLPGGFVTPGFIIYSRMFYLPGVFVALASGTLIASSARRWRTQTAVAVGLLILWTGMTARRYLSDMRDGSRIVRAVASRVAAVPVEESSRGLLIIAPEVVGTFSTSAVQSSSLRAAVRDFEGIEVSGPLYFAETCEAAASAGGKVYAEGSRLTDVRSWGAVVRYTQSGVVAGPTLDSVRDK